MAGPFCESTAKLDPTIFTDVCVGTNSNGTQENWDMTEVAFKRCCAPSHYDFTDDQCYFYCNITTPLDINMFGNCLADTAPAAWDWSEFSWDCYPLAWETATATQKGVLATTWSYPDNTWTDTITLSSGVLSTRTETDNYWGTPLTAVTTTSSKGAPAATGSAATKTSGSTDAKSTSSSAAPTSSTKLSGARPRWRVLYGGGVLVVLSILSVVL